MKNIAIVVWISLLVSGCGIDDQRTAENQLNQQTQYHFGTVADATVTIYNVDGAKKVVFREKTSAGENLDKIGNFNAHLDDLDETQHYTYEVRGGVNWDIDTNGIKDSTATPNTKVFRAVYQGKDSKINWWSTQTQGPAK